MVTARKLGDWPARSPEWHEARRWRLGGSEIGVVLGWSPFQTRADLLQAKLAGTVDDRKTPAMQRGNLLEDDVLDWLQDREGLAYDREYQGTFVANNDWQLYNPDAVTTDAQLIEAKTAGVRDAEHGWGRAGSKNVPLHYAAQVQWGMGVLGLRTCILAVLSGAPRFEFAQYRIPFDKKAFAYLTDKGERFINQLRQRQETAA